ncbi:uncharacterized protein LOC125047500 isoform X2 [Penaeus chinensis]|uniref:uncharacterized protein LOC125047500 isoform X2 n=1 Tax=Penaeus chinensis TaxID=139456 RepID=UPI001FB6307A|nr:uncharacterized protein LOC125047500 isoform X2 [Penaeus chinensis]
MNFKAFHIALAVLLAFLPNEIASQDNVLPSRPGGLLASSGGPVDGHDVGPLDEVAQLQPRADEVGGFVNGPTGTSVLTEERQDLEGAANVRYVNGPTSTSVEAEENRQTAGGQDAFVAGPEAAPGQPEESQPRQGPFVNGPTGTSVALEEGLRLPEEGRVVVNGPTGISVEAEEMQQGLDGDGIVSASSAQKNRGRISTDPEEAEVNQKIPSGLYHDTTDWSTDSKYWNYKAHDWSLVYLPDKDHPNLPSHEIPGPSLVVVTEDVVKKVYLRRKVSGLSKVLFHYRYFLSTGEYPNGVPSLKVYLVQENTSTVIADEESRGAWQDNNIRLNVSGTFEIIFEGRLMKEGNEIAVDDITIRGIGTGDAEAVEAGSDGQQESEIESSGTGPDEAGEDREGSVDETVANSTDVGNETSGAGDEANQGIAGPESGTEVPQNVTEEVEGSVTEAPVITGESEVESNATDIPIGLPEVTEGEGLNQGTENSSLVTVSVDSISSAPGNNSIIDNTTESALNETATISPATDSVENNTAEASQDPLAVNATVEVPENENMTLLITDSPVNATELPETNTTIISNGSASTASSGDAAVLAGDDTNSSSWGMFKIFLTISALGVAALGFLYWRKRRQQDDEIPVFTRSSHADYHNPTFSPEDDSSFASQGTRHNYKSFD